MTRTTRARRRFPRGVAALVLALAGVVGSGITAAPPARALDVVPDPLAVLVDGLTPAVPEPGGTLQASGRLVNETTTPVSEVTVTLWRSHRAVTTRSDLADLAAGDQVRPGTPVDSAVSVRIPQVPAHGVVHWQLSVPLDALSLGDFGVYPISFVARGLRPDGLGEVGIVHTFLPWVPAAARFRPTRLVWLWPLADTPSATSAPTASATLTDDHLACSLALDGRLGGLVQAVAKVPKATVTFAVDPDLLQTAATMADNGYRVLAAGCAPRAPDAQASAGTGQAAAAGWLTALRSVSARQQVVALPQADADVQALQQAGASAQVTAAVTRGRAVAADVLDRSVSGDIAWPRDGVASTETLNTLQAAGDTAVVLSSDVAQIDPARTYTPTGRTDVAVRSGTMTGLLADPTLSQIVAAKSVGALTEPLIVQRFLAETALITAERPGGAFRTVLVAPPHDWPVPASRALKLLQGSADAPWLKLAPLSFLRTRPVDDTVVADNQPVALPPSAVPLVPPRSAVLDAKGLLDAATTFSGALALDSTSTVDRFHDAAYRLWSSAWRDAPGRSELVAADRADLSSLQHSLRLVAARNVTLGSSSGRFSLLVQNQLHQPVAVRIRFTVDPPRLVITDPAPITVDAGRSSQVDIPAKAVANGVVIVSAQLTTDDGVPLCLPTADEACPTLVVTFRVRVTDYGTVGLLITFSAVFVLFAAAAMRVWRRARAARRHQQQDLVAVSGEAVEHR